MSGDAKQRVEQARAALAHQGADAAYATLCAYDGDDPSGCVSLECARVALALRQPQRALDHLAAAHGRADPAQVAYEAGRAHNNLRNFEAAEQSFLAAVDAQPRWADAQNALGHVRRAMGRFVQARDAYLRALDADPNHPRALQGVATMHAECGDIERAVDAAARALRANPGDVSLLAMLGRWQQQLGRPEAAVSTLARAVALAPTDAPLHSALGSAFQSQGDLEQARRAYTEALGLDPGLAPAAAGLAGVLDLTGDAQAASSTLAPFLKRPAPPAVVVLADANLTTNRQIDDATLGRLVSAINDPDTPAELRPLLRFRRADALDQRDAVDEAFAQYASANAARRRPLNVDQLLRFTERSRRDFENIEIATPEPRGRESVQPVFIVGLPRTGSTLVEQILSAHPAVTAAGETSAFGSAMSTLGKPLAQMAGDDAAQVRRLYWAHVGAIDGVDLSDAAWCTDKMWQNFALLPTIHRVFPHAVIVHTTRHPMAAGWSMFQRSFGAAPPPFTQGLEDIAAFIAHHDRLMAAWYDAGAPRTVHVNYETLVAHFEPEVARLLDGLGLDMHPACLDFHTQKRVVTTESFDQVTQPLYRRAVDRWRRYEKHLAPLAAALAGFGVDPDPTGER